MMILISQKNSRKCLEHIGIEIHQLTYEKINAFSCNAYKDILPKKDK